MRSQAKKQIQDVLNGDDRGGLKEVGIEESKDEKTTTMGD